MIDFLKEKIILADVDTILKLHMLIKSYEYGYNLSESDINTLFELYKTGYGPEFYKNCVDKQYFKSEQTVRNCIGRMTKLGILSYRKRGERFISNKFLPKTSENKIIIQYLVGNIDDNQ